MPTNQAGSQFWGTGPELSNIRDVLDPIEARQLIESLGRKIHGDKFNYSGVEFRGLNLLVTIVENSTGNNILVTPYWHLMTEDGYGNRI